VDRKIEVWDGFKSTCSPSSARRRLANDGLSSFCHYSQAGYGSKIASRRGRTDGKLNINGFRTLFPRFSLSSSLAALYFTVLYE
jgi:hypothetical protein